MACPSYLAGHIHISNHITNKVTAPYDNKFAFLTVAHTAAVAGS